MGLLWLVSIAIICYTTQTTTALPQNMKHSAGIISNNTDSSKNSINSTEIMQNKTLTKTNSTEIRGKRGTSAKASNLEKREIPKFRFSIWAGKRIEAPEEEKRAKFSSWGGKRADNDMKGIKRAKFSSWGGKRDDTNNELDRSTQISSWNEDGEADDMHENKRAKFNSWAGKRTATEDDKRAKFSSWAGKRGKFNSWAGKRSDLDITPDSHHFTVSWTAKPAIIGQNDYYLNEDKRAKFSSWAGKRNPDYLGTIWNNIIPDNRIKYYSSGMGDSGNDNIMKIWQDLMSRKRARFSSWAGKRSDDATPDMESFEGYFDPTLQEKHEDPEKRKFSSWGGKRDVNESYGEIVDEKEGYPSMIVKRSVFTWNSPSLAYKRKPVFSSWGGKRSHTIQIRSLPIQRVLMSGGSDRTWGSLMRPIRRGPDFYAWGGKRST